MKSRAMRNHTKVENLNNAPKPSYIPTNEIWRQYIDYWCSPEHQARSDRNKQNRAKNAGKSHGFGRKGPAARLVERVKAGKPPSMLAILKEVNVKKDKHGNLTGEFHNVPVNEATLAETFKTYNSLPAILVELPSKYLFPTVTIWSEEPIFTEPSDLVTTDAGPDPVSTEHPHSQGDSVSNNCSTEHPDITLRYHPIL